MKIAWVFEELISKERSYIKSHFEKFNWFHSYFYSWIPSENPYFLLINKELKIDDSLALIWVSVLTIVPNELVATHLTWVECMSCRYWLAANGKYTNWELCGSVRTCLSPDTETNGLPSDLVHVMVGWGVPEMSRKRNSYKIRAKFLLMERNVKYSPIHKRFISFSDKKLSQKTFLQ